MKRYIPAALAIALISVQSCKEIGPAIDFSGAVASDTTYEVSASGITPEARRILVEEATGVRCNNCPEGAEAIKGLEDANSGRLITVGLHAGSQTLPLTESQYDFRTDYAKDLMNLIGAEPAKPAAAFDRTVQGASIFTDRSIWPSIVSQRLNTPPPVNMQMTSTYDEVKKEAVIKIKVTYNTQVSKQQNLTVYITEDKIIDAQEDRRKTPPTVEDYEHNHVLRDMLTLVPGAAMIDSIAVKKPGRVYERTFIYKLPEKALATPVGEPYNTTWNINNLNVIAFVHNNEGADKEVAQVVKVPLKP